MGGWFPARMEQPVRWLPDAGLAQARPSPLRFDAARNPFSKAIVRRAKFAAELPATVLISPGNSAAPARRFSAHWFGGARLLTSRAIQALLDFVFRAARGDRSSLDFAQTSARPTKITN